MRFTNARTFFPFGGVACARDLRSKVLGQNRREQATSGDSSPSLAFEQAVSSVKTKKEASDRASD